MGFEPGTVVWVKLQGGRVWWAGQVTSEFPENLLLRIRKDPIAVVKFFSEENEFEIVKKESDILLYNCERKEDFIKKGKHHLDLEKSKVNLKKFIADCKKAEILTGGKEELVDSVEKVSPGPKKPLYADLFKPEPPPTPPKARTSQEYAALVKLTFKKPGSPTKKLQPSSSLSKFEFKCNECQFTTNRVSVLTSHRRTHKPGSTAEIPGPSDPDSSVIIPSPEKSPSPKKSNSPVKSPSKRGRKRKAPKESTLPAADKQEILADWSEEEGGSPESPGLSLDDLEPKKPRTDKELSDAFESLLKTTKPTEIAEIPESTDVHLKSDGEDVDNASEDEFVLSTSSTEELVKPAEESVKHTEELVKPTEELVKPTEEVVKPTEDLAKPVEEFVEITEGVKINQTEKDSDSANFVHSAIVVDLDHKPDPEILEKVQESETPGTLSEEAKKETEKSLHSAEIDSSSLASTHLETVVELSHQPEPEVLPKKVIDIEIQFKEEEKESTQEPASEVPTAKVIGVGKVVVNEAKAEEKVNLDDAATLESEVDALLALTKPVELNHEKLFASRPDLQYKVTPVQLKSEPIPSTETNAVLPVSPVKPTITEGRFSGQKTATPSVNLLKKTTPSVSPAKTVPMASALPFSTSALDVQPVSQSTKNVITMTHAMAIKTTTSSNSVKQGFGTPGALKITKAPPPTLLQEKIVVLPPDSASNPSKVQSTPGGIVPGAVKVYSALPITSAPPSAVLAATVKKGRAKKQTLTERVGVVQSSMISQAVTVPHSHSTPVSLLLSSGVGTPVQTGQVQTVHSFQTKVSAPTTSSLVSSGLKATPTGMVRLTASAMAIQKQQQLQRASASPSILTKPPVQQFRYQRQTTPGFTPSPTPASHYEIISSGTGSKQDGSDIILVSQPPKTQQQFVLASSGLVQSSPAGQKKRPPTPAKKAATATVLVRTPEPAKSKPTAAIKPNMNEEEQANSTKIRQALMAGQKPEKIFTAEKVVHLLPMQNPDGTVTYMLVHLDDQGGGIQIDSAEGTSIHGELDPIYIDKEVSADKFVSTIVQQNTPLPVVPSAKKVTNRRVSTSKTPNIVSPRSKTSQQHRLIGPADQLKLQQAQQTKQTQPRQIVIGQQQVQTQALHQSTSGNQQLHQIAQGQKQPASVAQYQILNSQTVTGQQAQRQVFVTQSQTGVSISTQPHQLAVNSVQHSEIHPPTQGQGFQIEDGPAITTATVSLAPSESYQTHAEGVAGVHLTPAQEPVQGVAVDEIHMPALIDAKTSAPTATLEEGHAQADQPMESVVTPSHDVVLTQQVEATSQEGSVVISTEVPMETQGYQIVTGEDGNEYYVGTGENLMGDVAQGYYQIPIEDPGQVNYDVSDLPQGDGYYIVQDDGTVVAISYDELLALQQQQLQETQEVQAHDPNQSGI